MVRHHRIASAIVLTLTLATAAPAAARLELNPSAPTAHPSAPQGTKLCSEVCSASGYTAAKRGAALPHDPRARSVALAGAGYGYGSSPVASSGAPAPRSEVVSGGGYGHPNAPVTWFASRLPA